MKFIAKYDTLILQTTKGAVNFQRGEFDTKDQALIVAIKETPAYTDGQVIGVTEKELSEVKDVKK